MTNQERAAQIVNSIVQEIPVLTSNRQRLLHKEIMSQLDEAIKEAKDEQWKQDMEHCEASTKQSRVEGFEDGLKKGRMEGWNLARDKAAGIAANLMFELGEPSYAGAYGSKIAKRIRKMTNE